MDVIQVNIFAVFSGFSIIISALALFKIKAMNLRMHSEMDQIKAELLSTSSGSVGMGKRLLDIEKRLDSSLSKQEEYQQGYTPYARATEMLGAGSDVNDLIKNCGISRAEAELMQLMHRQMKRCGPTHKR